MRSKVFIGGLLATTLILPFYIFVRYNSTPVNYNNSANGILLEEGTLGKIVTRNRDSGWRVLEDEWCKPKPEFVLSRLYPADVPIYVYKPEDDIYISEMIINSGSWEAPLIEKVVKAMEEYPDAVFIDIGANLGVYSITMAAKGRRVISIDCNRENVMRLCASASKANITNKISIVHNGVSDSRKDLKLVESSMPNVGGMGVETISSATNVSKSLISSAIILDDLLEIFKIESAIMKMDVEKHEDEIFKGAKTFFERVRVEAILLEFRFHTTDVTGQYIIDFLDKFDLEPELPRWVNKANYSTWPGDLMWKRKVHKLKNDTNKSI